jgi:hypothetical protein
MNETHQMNQSTRPACLAPTPSPSPRGGDGEAASEGSHPSDARQGQVHAHHWGCDLARWDEPESGVGQAGLYAFDHPQDWHPTPFFTPP